MTEERGERAGQYSDSTLVSSVQYRSPTHLQRRRRLLELSEITGNDRDVRSAPDELFCERPTETG